MKFSRIIASPIGPLTLVGNGAALVGLYINRHVHPPKSEHWQNGNQDSFLKEAEQQLSSFFKGEIQNFSLPIQPHGTEFQIRCWTELSKIPYGETISYGEMARRLGNPDASRAVGAANGQNPISVIVPCHRVIGANGKLVGFGGGIPRKAALLAFERAICFGESAEEFWEANPIQMDTDS
jgi:methylated-DNA-[protein]-cysteine S-methyltransferase